MKHREGGWEKYVRKKGNDKEIIKYYKDQQKILLKLSKQTKIPVIIEDTTDMNFDKIKKTILKIFNKDN